MKKYIVLIFSSLCLLMQGCGFHLPNQTKLSNTFEKINVSGDYHDPFYKKVVRELEIAGINVNAQFSPNHQEDALVPTLLIPAPSVSTPIASIDANAETLEYQLIVSSTTTLRIPNHRPIIMRNSLTRNMMNKPGLALSSDNERKIVTDETYDELASQLVTRLGYLGRQSDPDALQSTPADLTVAVGEDKDLPKSKTLSDAYSGMTLLEALQLQESEDLSNSSQTSLSELNNGNQVLNRSYKLPKCVPTPASALPPGLDPNDYDINEHH